MASSPANPTAPTPGILWITSSIKKPDLAIPVFDAWYDEHMTDVLSTPGNNGGLFLRYKNVNPDADPYTVPTFNDGSTSTPAAATTWPYLALVKLDDIAWVASQEFVDIPRHSKILPKEKPDGSDGSAYTCCFAALRSYKTVGKIYDRTHSTARPKYILAIQSKHASGDLWQTLDSQYMERPGFRGSVRYQLKDGLLAFQEPGPLPAGLALYEFDGDEPPRPDYGDEDLTTEVWELTHEVGDSTLRL